jgi:hypothetical protein
MSLARRSIFLFLRFALIILVLLYGRDVFVLISDLSHVHSFADFSLQVGSKYKRLIKGVTKTLFPRQNKYQELKDILRTLVLKRNFASESSGARVVSKSKFIQHSNALIGKNKYNTGVLFDCSLMSETSPAFIIVDMIEDFYLEEVLLVSRSVYTNQIRDFKISSSLDLSQDHWIELGKFRNDKNGIYSHFSVKNSALTRYVKLEILTAYEEYKQFYCSISEMRVFGQTMTSFAKRRNEVYLKDSRELDKVRLNAALASNDEVCGSPGTDLFFHTAQDFALPSLKQSRSSVNANYVETCPARDYRSLFLAKTPTIPKEKYVDPYFELYDYLFNNIKDLKLNVDSLIRNVVKEKHLLSPQDPLRSYLQTFIKDRTQILKRIKGLEEDISVLAQRSRKLNSLMFLELRTNKMEAWIRRLVESKRRKNTETDSKIRDLSAKIEALNKETQLYFTACIGVFILFFVCLLVNNWMLRARIDREKSPTVEPPGPRLRSSFKMERLDSRTERID